MTKCVGVSPCSSCPSSSVSGSKSLASVSALSLSLLPRLLARPRVYQRLHMQATHNAASVATPVPSTRPTNLLACDVSPADRPACATGPFGTRAPAFVAPSSSVLPCSWRSSPTVGDGGGSDGLGDGDSDGGEGGGGLGPAASGASSSAGEVRLGPFEEASKFCSLQSQSSGQSTRHLDWCSLRLTHVALAPGL